MEQFARWKRTLGSDASGNAHGLEKLRHSYLSFRERVSYLVADIGALLPGLTDHSILHLGKRGFNRVYLPT